jgi:hypothetical protein
MAAAKMARDHGWKTDGQITEDLDGDYEENLEAYAREAAARDKAGFAEPARGNGNQPPPAAPEPEEDDEDKDIEDAPMMGKGAKT